MNGLNATQAASAAHVLRARAPVESHETRRACIAVAEVLERLADPAGVVEIASALFRPGPSPAWEARHECKPPTAPTDEQPAQPRRDLLNSEIVDEFVARHGGTRADAAAHLFGD